MCAAAAAAAAAADDDDDDDVLYELPGRRFPHVNSLLRRKCWVCLLVHVLSAE